MSNTKNEHTIPFYRLSANYRNKYYTDDSTKIAELFYYRNIFFFISIIILYTDIPYIP